MRDKNRQDFLASLHFPEINSRKEGIDDAYKETFQWIFDPSDEALRPWSNFMRWLAKDSGFYWINGKAGSGKSTLMNYIQDDSRTMEALQTWAGSSTLIVPVFFFCAAGTTLQKSICGLLRSLIYQILKRDPQLIDKIIEQGGANFYCCREISSYGVDGAKTRSMLLEIVQRSFTFSPHLSLHRWT